MHNIIAACELTPAHIEIESRGNVMPETRALHYVRHACLQNPKYQIPKSQKVHASWYSGTKGMECLYLCKHESNRHRSHFRVPVAATASLISTLSCILFVQVGLITRPWPIPPLRQQRQSCRMRLLVLRRSSSLDY